MSIHQLQENGSHLSGDDPPENRMKIIQRKVSGAVRSLSRKRSQSLNRLLSTSHQIVANPLISGRDEAEDLQDAELFEKDYVQVY